MTAPDPIVDRLLAEHVQMRVIADELVGLLNGAEPADADLLGDCRWRLARLMMRHLPVEDRHIFRRIGEHPDPAIRRRMAAFRADLDQRFEQFRLHSERWTVEAARAEWPAYRAASRRQLMVLDQGIRLEETEIYPLLAGAPPSAPDRSSDMRNWAGDAWAIRAQLGR